MSSASKIFNENSLAMMGIKGVRQRGTWMRGSASTSMNGTTGLYSGTVLTTDSTPVNTARGRDIFGAYYDAVTSAVIGNNAGHSFNPNGDFLARETPSATKFSIKFGRVTNMRCFIGLSASTTLGSGIDADTLTVNSFGIQFSPTTRGDTTFQLVAFNGSQSLVSTSLVPADNSLLEAILFWTNTSEVCCDMKLFSTTGAFVSETAKITTNLITSTTALVPNFGCETRTAATLSMKCYGVETENWSI